MEDPEKEYKSTHKNILMSEIQDYVVTIPLISPICRFRTSFFAAKKVFVSLQIGKIVFLVA